MKVLHLYAGLGGNRRLWDDCEVTAVEMNPEIAAVYQDLYPDDKVIIGDAHEYLRKHYASYDFIWSSPPCPTHSKMAKATRHLERHYPDMKLYAEILFLQHYFKGKWVVENVQAFFEPLIKPTKQVGRHWFWSNFQFHADDVPTPPNFINLANLEGMRKLQDWHGIHYEKPIYLGSNHCPCQALRNCVPGPMGLQIYQAALGHKQNELENLPLFTTGR